MKIYLASRYSRFPEMQGYRADLEEIGHEVTSRWINGDHETLDDDLTQEDDAQRFAEEDLEDIEDADCIISFTENPRSTHTRGGRHVEFGFGLATNKRLMIIGWRENVFHCLPEVELFKTWELALKELRREV